MHVACKTQSKETLEPRNNALGICEGFNDWGGRGYDNFVPGEVTKIAPAGDETT